MLEKDEQPDPEQIAMYDAWREADTNRENDPEWQKNNMEYEIRTTDWILEKVRSSETYSQNLYAAICNNDFIKNEVFPILKDEYWHCSWRHAGGIIADMREQGDYMDWYMSGNIWEQSADSVEESFVTDEIREDLLKLGWIIKENTHGE